MIKHFLHPFTLTYIEAIQNIDGAAGAVGSQNGPLAPWLPCASIVRSRNSGTTLSDSLSRHILGEKP
jgi:hypothetical protein